MKCTIAPMTLVIVSATMLVLGIVPRAQAGEDKDGEHKECSNATLKGSYGFTSIGTLVANVPADVIGPFTEIGRQTFDGKGNTEATATASANGTIVKLTIQGTYVVNPDCTGSAAVYVAPLGATSHTDFVIDQDGAELRAIVTDPGLVESRVYTKQFSGDRKN